MLIVRPKNASSNIKIRQAQGICTYCGVSVKIGIGIGIGIGPFSRFKCFFPENYLYMCETKVARNVPS